MMRSVKYFIIAVLLVWGAWAVWCYTGYSISDVDQHEESIIIKDFSTQISSGRQLLIFQPYMEQIDYASEDNFYHALSRYFEQAAEANLIGDSSVLLLPEYLSSWLVVAEEKRSVILASDLSDAMLRLVASSPVHFLKHFFRADELDKAAASVFRMNSKKMNRIFSNVFSRLAVKYNIDIVAGSIILPAPSVIDGHLYIDPYGDLYNCTFTFLKNGTVHPTIIKKVYPTNEELSFITPGKIEDLRVISLSAGAVGNIVCADSWYPQIYQKYESMEAEILLVNAFCSGDGIMSKPWKGYNGASPPLYEQQDTSILTEGQAWYKYALPGRIDSTSIPIGATSYLRGQLWNMGSDGRSFVFFDKGAHPILLVDDEGVIIRLIY